MRTLVNVQGRSINLALSVRGITALESVGLNKLALDSAIPMKGRMIHSPDGSSTSVVPYGDFGEVCFLTRVPF
jgi:kynurenine 3-monooxygenase